MVLPIALLILCGALIAVQATLNAALGRGLGLPFFAAVFSLIQFAVSLLYFASGGWPKLGLVAAQPWLNYAGGVLGVFILAGMAYGFAKIGTFAGLVSILLGQVAMGIVIDQYGLFSAQVFAVNWQRIAGLLLILGGVALVHR